MPDTAHCGVKVMVAMPDFLDIQLVYHPQFFSTNNINTNITNSHSNYYIHHYRHHYIPHTSYLHIFTSHIRKQNHIQNHIKNKSQRHGTYTRITSKIIVITI